MTCRSFRFAATNVWLKSAHMAGRFSIARVTVVLALITALVAVRLLTPESAFAGLDALTRDAITLGISVFVESFPFVVLGVIVSTIVAVWLPQNVLELILPRNPWLRRMVISCFGVLLPVCECGNVPLSRGLLQRGFSVGDALTFLLAAPILNPVTIITTYQAFGFDDGILLGRIIGGFVIANLVGWLFARQSESTLFLTPGFAASCQAASPSRTTRWGRSLDQFATEMTVMLPALMVGAALAAAIQTGVSRNLLIELGANPIWSVLALAALAFVVSICSTVDAFFILSLSSLFLPGATVTFLVLGAMIDIKMLALLRTTFRARTLIVVTAVVVLASLVLGFGVNLIV